MNIILTFIEIFFMLMIYHTIFIGLANNIKRNILRSFIGGLICIIFISIIGEVNIYVNLSILVMCILMTSKVYKKHILVNSIELVISFLIVPIIEVIFMIPILAIFKNGDIPDFIYYILLLLVFPIVIYFLNKVVKKWSIIFEEFLIKYYSSIYLVCIDIIILFLFIKIIFEANIDKFLSIIEMAVLFLFFILVNIYYFINIYKMDIKKKKDEIKRSINPLIQELIDEMKASEHEYKNHLNILYCMIQVCKEDELRDRAKKYIGNVFENRNLLNSLSNIENTILKAVLLSKINQAEKSKITCNYKINSHLDGIPLDDSELTVVLSNLFNNAIEATSKSEKKFIEILTERNNGKYIIKVSNSADNLKKEMLSEIDKVRFSTKGSGRGYGLYNIKNIVSKYKGKVHISIEDDIFNVCVEI